MIAILKFSKRLNLINNYWVCLCYSWLPASWWIWRIHWVCEAAEI